MIDEVFAGTTESLISLAQAAAGTMPTAEEAHEADAAGGARAEEEVKECRADDRLSVTGGLFARRWGL